MELGCCGLAAVLMTLSIKVVPGLSLHAQVEQRQRGPQQFTHHHRYGAHGNLMLTYWAILPTAGLAHKMSAR